MQDLSPEQVAQIWEVISRGYQYDLGKPTIIAQIVNLGYDRETAIQLVDELEQPFLRAMEQAQAEKKGAKESAKVQLALGIACLVGGGVITLGTYLLASSYGGGIYIVTTGLFLVGGLLLLRGLIRWYS